MATFRFICRFTHLSGAFSCLLIHMCRNRLEQARTEPPIRVNSGLGPDRTTTLVPSATTERSQAATLAVYWSSPANWDRASWPRTVRPPGSVTRVKADEGPRGPVNDQKNLRWSFYQRPLKQKYFQTHLVRSRPSRLPVWRLPKRQVWNVWHQRLVSVHIKWTMLEFICGVKALYRSLRHSDQRRQNQTDSWEED